jgi:hypothetical protein
MRPVRGIALLGTAYALAGCGATPAQDVSAKLQQFAHAVAARDTATLCDQVLAPALVAHLQAAGLTCRQAITVFVDSVSDPTISVSKIVVGGHSASAVVLSGARGQQSSLESVQLIDTPGGWRLASLASPR